MSQDDQKGPPSFGLDNPDVDFNFDLDLVIKTQPDSSSYDVAASSNHNNTTAAASLLRGAEEFAPAGQQSEPSKSPGVKVTTPKLDGGGSSQNNAQKTTTGSAPGTAKSNPPPVGTPGATPTALGIEGKKSRRSKKKKYDSYPLPQIVRDEVASVAPENIAANPGRFLSAPVLLAVKNIFLPSGACVQFLFDNERRLLRVHSGAIECTHGVLETILEHNAVGPTRATRKLTLCPHYEVLMANLVKTKLADTEQADLALDTELPSKELLVSSSDICETGFHCPYVHLAAVREDTEGGGQEEGSSASPASFERSSKKRAKIVEDQLRHNFVHWRKVRSSLQEGYECFDHGLTLPLALPNSHNAVETDCSTILVTQGAREFLFGREQQQKKLLRREKDIENQEETKGKVVESQENAESGEVSGVANSTSQPEETHKLNLLQEPPTSEAEEERGLESDDDDEEELGGSTSAKERKSVGKREELNSSSIIRSKSVLDLNELQHCAHYKKNGMCCLGPTCKFVHALGDDEDEQNEEQSPPIGGTGVGLNNKKKNTSTGTPSTLKKGGGKGGGAPNHTTLPPAPPTASTSGGILGRTGQEKSAASPPAAPPMQHFMPVSPYAGVQQQQPTALHLMQPQPQYVPIGQPQQVGVPHPGTPGTPGGIMIAPINTSQHPPHPHMVPTTAAMVGGGSYLVGSASTNPNSSASAASVTPGGKTTTASTPGSAQQFYGYQHVHTPGTPGGMVPMVMVPAGATPGTPMMYAPQQPGTPGTPGLGIQPISIPQQQQQMMMSAAASGSSSAGGGMVMMMPPQQQQLSAGMVPMMPAVGAPSSMHPSLHHPPAAGMMPFQPSPGPVTTSSKPSPPASSPSPHAGQVVTGADGQQYMLMPVAPVKSSGATPVKAGDSAGNESKK